jgi:hypothetical protein
MIDLEYDKDSDFEYDIEKLEKEIYRLKRVIEEAHDMLLRGNSDKEILEKLSE